MDKPDLYRLVSRGEGDTIAGTIIGTMVEFPSGRCVIEWNGEAWPQHKRLSGPHHSLYDSMGDVKTATNCDIRQYHGTN